MLGSACCAAQPRDAGCSHTLMHAGRAVPPRAAVERGTIKCAPYFAEAPRTAKALGRFTVQTADVEEVGVAQASRTGSGHPAGAAA